LGAQAGCFGAFPLALSDECRNVSFRYELPPDVRVFVPGASGCLSGVQVDQVLINETLLAGGEPALLGVNGGSPPLPLVSRAPPSTVRAREPGAVLAVSLPGEARNARTDEWDVML
jgi:hypothetical protein